MLSYLELTVLGIAYKKGPLSGYAILQEFSFSRGPSYRSGAGSIYPILKRLTASGHLIAEAASRGSTFQISSLGMSVLKEWFLARGLDEDFGCSLDTLRSRLYFMRILSPNERAEFVATALARLRALLEVCESDLLAYRAADDPFGAWAMEGAVSETRARINWMEGVESRLPSLP